MDGTGPLGQGAGTCGGLGRCGRGRGFGRSRGYKTGFATASQNDPFQDNPNIEPETGCEKELTHDESLVAELHALREQSSVLEEKFTGLTKLVAELNQTKDTPQKKTDKAHK
jgi:hypothetical protein